jgi:hypothetical protein
MGIGWPARLWMAIVTEVAWRIAMGRAAARGQANGYR